MTQHYLVEHASDDYRLHRSNGTETGDSWTTDPRENDEVGLHQAVLEDMGVSSATANAIADYIVSPYHYRRDDDTPW